MIKHVLQAGRLPADNVIGRFLMDLTMKVPQIDPQEFEEMLNSNMKVSAKFGINISRHQPRWLTPMHIRLLIRSRVQSPTGSGK